jgi:O-antigen/teichoic acid export membrane protein
MALAIICQLLQTHLAIPVLGYYSTKFAVGIFSAAATLLIVVDHITTAILTVQYPKVAKLDDLNSQISFVKQTLFFSFVIVLFLSPGLFIIEPIIQLLYGQEYVGSTPVFQILFIGLLAALISQPLNLLFLARNKSHYWSIMAIFSLLIWFIVGYFLIPKQGAVGAAWTTTIARFSNTIMTFTLLFRTLYVEKRNENKLAQH